MSDLHRRLLSIVGDRNVFAGDAIEGRYKTEFMGKYPSSPGIVVCPTSTAELAQVVVAASEADCPITTHGGRTGLVGGTQSEAGGLVLSLERMTKILEVDTVSMTMTVEAGVTLQTAHEAAEQHGLLLPLDLGARGSATIGGTVATNAGGLRVLRWGMMRDMILGLEAVTADGEILSAMNKTIKDNAGYRWPDLFVGSEGTLAIITKAVLRLRPQPTSWQTALVSASDFTKVTDLLGRLHAELSGTLSSCLILAFDGAD